jgi:hypothetical protein
MGIPSWRIAYPRVWSTAEFKKVLKKGATDETASPTTFRRNLRGPGNRYLACGATAYAAHCSSDI